MTRRFPVLLFAAATISLASAVSCGGGGSTGGPPGAGTSGGAGGAAGTGGTESGVSGAGGSGGSGVAGSGGVGTSDGGGGSAGGSGGAGRGGAGAGGPDGGVAGAIKTVFVILEENHNWDSIHGSSDAPYINTTLLPMSSYATNYKGADRGQLHPSEPNYIWLEAGSNANLPNGNASYAFQGDGDPSASNQSTTTEHLVTLLNAAGISWKSYQEDLPQNGCGAGTSGLYAPKHNPMVFFTDVTSDSAYCNAHVVPLSQLAADLQNNTVARYNFITPNLCNDMHGDIRCLFENTVSSGDTWLKDHVPMILSSPAYRDGGALFITWDESETQSTTCAPNCPSIGMMVLSPRAKGNGYNNAVTYDHSSYVKTVQEIFGLTPLLRHAGDAATSDLADLFTAFP